MDSNRRRQILEELRELQLQTANSSLNSKKFQNQFLRRFVEVMEFDSGNQQTDLILACRDALTVAKWCGDRQVQSLKVKKLNALLSRAELLKPTMIFLPTFFNVLSKTSGF